MTSLIDGTDVATGNAYQLAKLAGCLQPDDENSHGARWLDELAWLVSRRPDPEHARARADYMAVSPPEWHMWKLYAELGGWQVEMIGSPTNMTANARKALRHIAYKLATAVIYNVESRAA
jgi:hypothetical protein